MSKKTAVIIVNYNGWQDTVACAESILAGTVLPEWLIIVDNASTDDSLRWLRHWAKGHLECLLPELGVAKSFPKPLPFHEITESESKPGNEPENAAAARVILLPNRTNSGYAAGNNAGMAWAMARGADAFWVLNNDTVLAPGALAAMRDRLFSKARPGLCGSLIQYMGPDGLVQCRAGGRTNPWTGLSELDGNGLDIASALLDEPDDVEQRLNFIYGASVMASRHFVQTVGFMDERYFLYCEEQDWAYSARGKFDFAYAREALVWHKEGGATGFSTTRFNARSLWHLTRSRLLLTWKHKPAALPTVFLSILFAGLRLVWRRALASPPVSPPAPPTPSATRTNP